MQNDSVTMPMVENHGKEKLKTLAAIRTLGMLLIFIQHNWGFLPFKVPDFGGRGVDLFFLLSGFLMMYNI